MNFLPIDKSLQLGTDRKGIPVFDGDDVLSFNLMDDGETWPLSGPKRGVKATLRRMVFLDGKIGTVVSTDTGSTGCRDTSDPQYGVEKL